MMRMPADWWDSPTAVGCPLSRGPQSARAARRLTRSTLRDWGLAFLAEDAEAIVGEFVANAVTHAAALARVPVRVAAGFGDPFYPGVQALARALPKRTGGVPPEVSFSNGCHDSSFFTAQEPPSLAFLARHQAPQ